MQRKMGIVVVVVAGIAMGALVTAAVQKVSGLMGKARATELNQQHIEMLK